jgi:hypothetical protein
VNTPRNRLVHTALGSVSRLGKDRELQCPVRATVEPSRHHYNAKQFMAIAQPLIVEWERVSLERLNFAVSKSPPRVGGHFYRVAHAIRLWLTSLTVAAAPLEN